MRIIVQSSLLTLFCIFLDSTEAQNKKLKTYDIQKNTEKIIAKSVAGQRFNSKSEISDEINDERKIKSKKKCKGKSCKYESSNEDEDSRGEREENSRKYMAMNQQKYEKYSNDFVKVKNPLKHHHAEKTSIRNLLKNGSSEQREESEEEETKTSSKNRIIENVIFVKDKLAHLKKKIGGIDSTEFDSRKKNDNKKKKKSHKEYQIYSKSYQTNEINNIEDADDSSEEHSEPFKEDKHKIKSKLLENGENTQRKKELKSVLYESKTNKKKSKLLKNTEEIDSMELGSMEVKPESDGVVEKVMKSDENIDEEENNTCEKIKGGRKKEDENCNHNGDEGYEEDSNLHNKKYKFSIKYAHEKKKVFHNKDDRFVKKIHGVDKKKRRLGDEDDDSDEDEGLPKRLHHVIDDED